MGKLLTVVEIAEKYGKHEETIRRWIREKKLIPQKRGFKGMYLINEDDVFNLINKELIYKFENIKQLSIIDQLHEMKVRSSNVYSIVVGDKFTYNEFTEIINNRGVKGIRYRTGDPNVSIITTISGTHDNPYEDRFENGTLFYTGEGRNGDQELKFGNLRLYECQIEKTPVHVFQKVKDNHYMFLGLFKVMDFHIENQPGDDKNIRNVFIFELKPIVKDEIYTFEDFSKNSFKKMKLWEEIKSIEAELDKSNITKSTLTKRYNRSRRLAESLKQLYDYRCQLCDPNNPLPIIEMKDGRRYVEVHHIKGFSEVLNDSSENQESGDFVIDSINNVICVCALHHKMLHHYKSPLHYDGFLQSFISEDESLEQKVYTLHHRHKIGGE